MSGLQAETEYEQYQEGGVNDYIHYLPKRTKYPALVLKRGMTYSAELWDWYAKTIDGETERRSGTIVLLDADGYEECSWIFFDSYPVKWNGPELSASKSEVAVESIELVHNGLKTVFKNA